MNDICFVVPTYPPHYLHAKDFLDSYTKYHYDKQADLYFVFTNPEERDGFLPCNAIVLPKSLRIMKNRGIINIKKFYALMQLKNRYKYIIVLDDDCIFSATVDLLDLCSDYFARKVLYGNILQDPPFNIINSVVENCKRFYPKAQRQKLNCPLYLWFNQVPIYSTENLDDFFQLSGIDHEISKLTWEDFDYYIYMYYLILQCGFQAEDMGVVAPLALSELCTGESFSVYSNIFQTEKIYMATAYAKQTFVLQDVFITLHNDRVYAKKQKGIEKLYNSIKNYIWIRRVLK